MYDDADVGVGVVEAYDEGGFRACVGGRGSGRMENPVMRRNSVTVLVRVKSAPIRTRNVGIRGESVCAVEQDDCS